MNSKENLEQYIHEIDRTLAMQKCKNCQYSETIRTDSETFISYRSGGIFNMCLCHNDISSHYFHVVDLGNHVCEDWSGNEKMRKLQLAQKEVYEAELRLLEVMK